MFKCLYFCPAEILERYVECYTSLYFIRPVTVYSFLVAFSASQRLFVVTISMGFGLLPYSWGCFLSMYVGSYLINLGNCFKDMLL